MTHDYFYGSQSESFSYCRIPRLLVKGEQYRGVSVEAKLLYGLLLDRMGLSAKKGWYDKEGRVFIYYTLEEIMQDLGCSHNKACRLLAELDEGKGCGLIERRKQGQGKPARIYVKQFTDAGVVPPSSRLPDRGNPDFPKEEVQTAQNRKSRFPETGSADFPEISGSYNKLNQPEKSYPDPSIYPPEADGWIEDEVKEQIDYPLLAESYPNDDPDAIVGLICDTLSSRAGSIKIGGEALPAQKVKDRFKRLTFEHVAYVLDSLRESTVKIRNIRAYLLTALYNAPLTIGPYYAAAVRHDFG